MRKISDKVTMADLLDRYKDADMFSLTGEYNRGFSEEYPHGVYAIDEGTAENALNKVSEWSLEMLRGQYARFSEQEKSELPPFEKLVAEIQTECDDYFALVEKGDLPEGQSPFLADLMFSGKTRYSAPAGIWHFYHELYAIHMHYGAAIGEMRKNTEQRNVADIFENPYYKELEGCLRKTEVTFVWHCTTSSRLSVVYYFELNESSLSWLKKLKNDYDMKELGDLAFYKEGRVIFSSCTHERFHNGD